MWKKVIIFITIQHLNRTFENSYTSELTNYSLWIIQNLTLGDDVVKSLIMQTNFFDILLDLL